MAWGTTANTTQMEHATHAPLILATRGVIVLSTLVDMACLAGIVLTLRRFNTLCSIVPNPGGSGDDRRELNTLHAQRSTAFA